MEKTNWNQSLDRVPNIKQSSIDKWADEDAKIPKSKQTKGYSNFIEGYIHNVEGKYGSGYQKNEGSNDQAFTISLSKCDCKAGSGNCSHMVGLLYLISHYKRLGLSAISPVKSKISLPQTWHIPSRRKGVDGLKINKVKPKQPPKKKRRINEGILPNVYCPVENPIPANFTQTLIQELKAINSDAQILQVLPITQTVNTTFGPVAFGSPLSYQQKHNDHEVTDIINHPDIIFPVFPLPQLTCSYTTVLNRCENNKYIGFRNSKETSFDTEKQTQQQSHNKIWHNVRKKTE